MSSNTTPIDISNMPELLDLVHEVEETKTPRELKRDNKVVAVLSPVVQKQNDAARPKTASSPGDESTGDSLLRLAGIHGKGPADLSTRVDDYLYGANN